ncbi:helix-turn-helix transcriptional regulator [Candidatus Omnitrophota bacterium]
MRQRLKSVKDHLDKKLKDVYFKELYELEQEKMKLAKHFVDFRIKHDLTQNELADMLGVTQQHVSKLEEGIFSNIRDVAKMLLAIGYRIEFNTVHIPEKVSKKFRARLQAA